MPRLPKPTLPMPTLPKMTRKGPLPTPRTPPDEARGVMRCFVRILERLDPLNARAPRQATARAGRGRG